MDKSKLAEILTSALNTEAAGYAFYTRAADTISDAKGKNLFKRLAKEELQHIDVIASLSNRVGSGEKWPSYDEALKSGFTTREKKGLPSFQDDEEFLEKLENVAGDVDVIEIAIEIEDEAVAFYTSLLMETDVPDERVLLIELLEMEKSHLKALRWEHDELVKTGFWGDFMEFSVEKELG